MNWKARSAFQWSHQPVSVVVCNTPNTVALHRVVGLVRLARKPRRAATTARGEAACRYAVNPPTATMSPTKGPSSRSRHRRSRCRRALARSRATRSSPSTHPAARWRSRCRCRTRRPANAASRRSALPTTEAPGNSVVGLGWMRDLPSIRRHRPVHRALRRRRRVHARGRRRTRPGHEARWRRLSRGRGPTPGRSRSKDRVLSPVVGIVG